MEKIEIHGVAVDSQGRCGHYHSPRDVVANKCDTCGSFWACHKCHEELAGHPFGRMDSHHKAVLCGNCGKLMNRVEYESSFACPQCEHEFNPGCKTHRDLYFQ